MTLLPLPDGTRLLHIGPAKTGTTTLQNAFHVNRDALAAHGVRYAGPAQQARAAAATLALHRSAPGSGPKTMDAWDKLVAEVSGSSERCVVISSETFAHCDEAAADTAVSAFDAAKLQVVITMRPLADILPSAWQQYVQEGMRTPYDKWLRGILIDDIGGEKTTPSFWRRMRIDRVAQRWANRLGTDRVTIVSLAQQPHDYVLRVFEQLSGLPTGTLTPNLSSLNNSVPFQVVETIRAFNHQYWTLPEADKDHYSRVMPQGLLRALKYAGGKQLAKVPIGTPTWAAEKAASYMQEINSELRAIGVNVIGDLDALVLPSKPSLDGPSPKTVDVNDAASMLLAMMQAAEREGERGARRKVPQEIGAREALGIVRRRAVTRLRKR